jgi:pentatricopeptide repeat protein
VEISYEPQSVEQQEAIRWLVALLRSGAWRKDTRRLLHVYLWRAYVAAKRHVPTLASLMPDKAWDVLWDIQAKRNEHDPSRQSNLKELYHDMNSVGKATTLGQRIAYLENLFFNGSEDQALCAWEEDHNGEDTSSRHDYKPEHLELGAKLHALAGHPDRARDIMGKLFDLYPAWDTSVMVPVFRAHTELKSATHHDTAKTIYHDLKERLGSNMTLEHYDACFVGFLQARHLRYSKQVFRDMIKEGHLAISSSTEQIEEVLKRLNMLCRLGTDIEKMTSIALQVLSILPQPYHSHVFSEWMRSAVVRKAPQAAAQILDMMFSRGCQPETMHFNLLLKALFRTKDEPRVLKAENIAWQMIEEAMNTSSKKSSRASLHDTIAEKANCIAQTALDSESTRKVPKADISTFSLIMEHHATNGQWEHVDYLIRQLQETDIQPDADFMNVVMTNHCRKGKYSEAWKIYKSLTNVPEGTLGVFPNGASIRCLWRTLRIALGDHASRDDPGLPTPRELLAETVLWWSRCRSRHDVERFLVGLAAADHNAITSLMMHCFSYTQDFAGSLVALHVARSFSIYPNDTSAAIIQNQAAWVDMHRETESVRSQYHHSNTYKNMLEKLAQVYYILMERRLERAGLTEDDFDKMSDKELGDFGLNLLSEFIRVVMKRSYPPEAVEAMITGAKEEVGAPDMSTGDLDSFSVA